MQSFIVVGAGIVGAALASRLARSGAKVTVLDQAPEAGGIATARTFAWLNSAWGNAEPYHRLRVASLDEWRRLAKDIDGITPDWCGSVLWDLPKDELLSSVPTLKGWGYNVELVDGDFVRRLEPSLRKLPEIAVHGPDEGMIDAVEAARTFLSDAVAHGTTVHIGAKVDKLDVSDAKITGVILTDGKRIDADGVILASGAGTSELTEGLGVSLPIDAPPGLLALTEPQDKLLNGLVISPRAHVRQRPDGRLIAGTDFAGADPGEYPDKVAAEIVTTLQALIEAPDEIRLESYTVGYRPTPADGVSIAGQVLPGLTLAVTHSGVTLAPILAKLLATECLTGDRDPLLTPFGADRFQ